MNELDYLKSIDEKLERLIQLLSPEKEEEVIELSEDEKLEQKIDLEIKNMFSNLTKYSPYESDMIKAKLLFNPYSFSDEPSVLKILHKETNSTFEIDLSLTDPKLVRTKIKEFLIDCEKREEG